MKALGVVEWHLTQSPSYLLLVINWDAHGLLSLLFRGCTRTRQAPAHFYEGLSSVHDGFFHDVYGYLFFPTVLETDRLNNWQKVLRHTPVSMVEYYLIKVVGLFVDFLLSIGVVFTVGHVVRHVNMSPTGLGLVGLYSHPRKSSFCGSRSSFDPASFQSIDVCCGQSPLHGAGCYGWTMDAH